MHEHIVLHIEVDTQQGVDQLSGMDSRSKARGVDREPEMRQTVLTQRYAEIHFISGDGCWPA